jgi:hypothetical protein
MSHRGRAAKTYSKPITRFQKTVSAAGMAVTIIASFSPNAATTSSFGELKQARGLHSDCAHLSLSSQKTDFEIISHAGGFGKYLADSAKCQFGVDFNGDSGTYGWPSFAAVTGHTGVWQRLCSIDEIMAPRARLWPTLRGNWCINSSHVGLSSYSP